MRQVQTTKEKLFKRFKGKRGEVDASALAELLLWERGELFDYLLRMTGQVSKSMDTVDEVFQSLTEESLEGTASYVDLRLLLLTTARRFTADIWNADTPRLANAALEPPADGSPDVSEKAQRERALFRPLDKALRGLPGRQREVVLLRSRAALDWDEIAQVMGMGGAVVERTFVDALAHIDKEAPGLGDIDAALARMPGHPEPARSSQRTINLSMVMQGIKAKPVGLWSFSRVLLIVTVAMVLVAAVVVIAYPDLAAKLMAGVKARLFEDSVYAP